MDVSDIIELMVWFEEPIEEFLRPSFFKEVPRATRASMCQQENDAFPRQSVSILSKKIVISNCIDIF